MTINITYDPSLQAGRRYSNFRIHCDQHKWTEIANTNEDAERIADMHRYTHHYQNMPRTPNEWSNK